MYRALWQQKIFQAGAWLRYWLDAVNEHSLQAPFVYELYQQVIKPCNGDLAAAEALRQRLLTSDEQLEIRELGAGSCISNGNNRKISSIARHSLTPSNFSCLLYRLALYTKASNMLELGTSLGINTLYLASAAPNGNIHTIEGCPNTSRLAAKHFRDMAAGYINLHTGNIDNLLPDLLQQQLSSVDLAYLDANHTKEATLRYFEWLQPCLHHESVVVIDDIHWSEGMQEAWLNLCQHPSVSLSLDLYEAGLLFFRPGIQKQHYVVAY